METMPSLAAHKWELAQQVEMTLKSALSPEILPTYEVIDGLIDKLRVACQDAIFLDFEYATDVNIQERLWAAHVLINGRYRKMLEKFRKVDQKKSVVEKRKIEKHYVDFLKTSQAFYKGYIQRLASHFQRLDGLRRIAHCMALSTLAADKRVRVSEKVGDLIEQSCHYTLMRLGDLYRYRNVVRTKGRTWDHAMAHYSLARDLLPEDGSAHNQMAVVALSDTNHLDAVYYLYRAITALRPHALARGNLEIEFKKIETLHNEQIVRPGQDSVSLLTYWFLLLHAKFFDGVEFSSNEELEREVLTRLTNALKEQSLGEKLDRIVMINMAAECAAWDNVKGQGSRVTEKSRQTAYFCLAFNIRMMTTLLLILLPELYDRSLGDELPNESASDICRDKITAVARRVIPVIRQFCTWLAAGSAEMIVRCNYINPINALAREMWITYAAVLTRLVNFFPVEELAEVGYLLEEDASTVGFRPLRNDGMQTGYDIYTSKGGTFKPRLTDLGIEQDHPNKEMESRIRDIVISGLSLQQKQNIPLQLSHIDGNNTFVVSEDIQDAVPNANNVETVRSPACSVSKSPMATSSKGRISTNGYSHQTFEVAPDDRESNQQSSIEDDMARMVENLVDHAYVNRSNVSDETSYGMHSLTANEVFPSAGPCLSGKPKMLPSLSGLYNSAFAPQPHELQFTSPNRLLSHQVSTLSFATAEKRREAAAALDEMNGYTRSGNGSLARASAGPRFVPTVDISGQQQISQDSLSGHYIPVSSSGFTDSSSLYANTPRVQPHFGSLRNSFMTPAGNNTTHYPGATDFEKEMMLQSSLAYNGTQATCGHFETPPGGQDG